MFKKNTAVTGFQIGHFIQTADGAAKTTGTPTCKRLLDGTPGTLTNAASYDSTAGVWKIDLAAGDVNGDMVGLSFTLTDCLPIGYTLRTTTKLVSELNDLGGTAQTGDAYARLTGTVEPAIADVPTNAELATALGTADDATLAAIAALNNLSSAQAQTAAAAALTAYDPPTNAELEARTLLATDYATATALTAVDAVTDKIDTALVLDGAVYQFTANALELAPTGGSAPTAAAIRAEIDANSTQLAAIVADTGELQTDWVDGGRLDLLLDSASAGGGLDAAGVRVAIGMASANLDTQLGTVAKTGADSDTLETLSDQIDALVAGSGLTAQETADAVNNLAPSSTGATGSIRAKLDAIKLVTDAIDTSAVTVTAANDAGVLTVIQAVTFGATVSGLTISATWAKLYWTLKENIYDDDSEAILQLVESNPGAGTDGLLYLNSAAIVTPITVADGTLTVNQAGGIVTIAVTDNATVLLDAASELVWDIKTKDAAGNTVQNTTGTASIVRAVTQTI